MYGNGKEAIHTVRNFPLATEGGEPNKHNHLETSESDTTGTRAAAGQCVVHFSLSSLLNILRHWQLNRDVTYS